MIAMTRNVKIEAFVVSKGLGIHHVETYSESSRTYPESCYGAWVECATAGIIVTARLLDLMRKARLERSGCFCHYDCRWPRTSQSRLSQQARG